MCGERENREGRGVSKKEAKSLTKRGNIESEKNEREGIVGWVGRGLEWHTTTDTVNKY